MIRRSPTRIELKLEDLTDFDFIQKFEKKKAPNAVPGAVGGISAADAQKFIRQDRVGFRPIRGTNSGPYYPSEPNNVRSETAAATVSTVVLPPSLRPRPTSTSETQTVDTTVGGSTPAGASGTAVRSSNTADMDISNDGDVATPSHNTAESNISNIDTSLDESL